MTHQNRNRRWWRMTAGIAGLIIAAPLIAACQGSAPAPTTAPTSPSEQPTLAPVDPLSFGVLRAPTGALMVVTGDKGWFRENGVEMEFQSFAEGGGPAIIQAMAGGTPDVALLNAAAVILALGQGTFDVQIVSVAADPSKALPLLAVEGINSVEDLRGKRVSTPGGGGQFYLLSAILAKHGMTFDDIDFRPMPVGEAQAAFITGSLDAVISSANGTVLIKQNVPGVHVLFDGQDFAPADGYSSPDVLIATSEAVRDNPEGIARFIRAYHEYGVAFVNDPATRDEAIQAIQDYMTSVGAGVEELEATRQAVDAIQFFTLAEAKAKMTSPEFLTALETQAQFLFDRETIPVMPDFSKALNTSFLE